jgi:dolichol-phosphate mannosyltransferase
MNGQLKKLTVVTFFHNEEGNLSELRSRIETVWRKTPYDLEVVLVDDASNDGSEALARAWKADDYETTYLRFSRNFGSHAALAAGLAHSTGDFAVIMAADLQDPPEIIPDLINEHLKGYDIVWACRSERLGESFFTIFTAAIYYRLLRNLGLPNTPPKGADFLLISKKVILKVNQHLEKNTSVYAMILWMGFNQAFIEYVKQARKSGVSKWTLSKKVKLLIDSIIPFSYVPIRFMSLLGILLSSSGFLYAFFVLLARLAGWVTTGTGFAAIMTVLLVGQGTILLTLGILGEYLWRTYDESRGRPRYIVDEVVRHVPVADRS